MLYEPSKEYLMSAEEENSSATRTCVSATNSNRF